MLSSLFSSWQAYGRDRVSREDLSITGGKRHLLVSNGDVPPDMGSVRYFIGMGISLPLTIGTLLLLFYTLASAEQRAALESPGDDQSVNRTAAASAIVLFFLIGGVQPLGAALIMSAACITVVICGRQIRLRDDRD